MNYASRKKATLQKKYTTSDNVLYISLLCNDRMNHQKHFINWQNKKNRY